jgi:hypothetical protein
VKKWFGSRDEPATSAVGRGLTGGSGDERDANGRGFSAVKTSERSVAESDNLFHGRDDPAEKHSEAWFEERRDTAFQVLVNSPTMAMARLAARRGPTRGDDYFLVNG